MDKNKNPSLLQGSYYLATGLWPFFHMRSFLAVTGPKADLWLVRTVGALVASLGAGLIVSGRRRELSSGMALAAAASAMGLGLIETREALRGRIRKIYLADAVVEGAIVAGWGATAGFLQPA